MGAGGYNTPTSHNIYFGRRLIQSNGKTVLTDRLGSVRANESGETFEYVPYGEELPVKNPQDREKFGSYMRESPTGLDYAVERYYASGLGRFTSPDPYDGRARPKRPERWNRYAYAMHDPINLVDPSGLYPCGSTLAYGSDGTISTTVYDCPDLLPANLSQPVHAYPVLTIQEWDDVHPHPCPPTPPAPPGVDIDQNVQDALNFLGSLPVPPLNQQAIDFAKAGYLVANFFTGQPEDYKTLDGDAYREFGNFNYGAVAFALGLSPTTI